MDDVRVTRTVQRWTDVLDILPETSRGWEVYDRIDQAIHRIDQAIHRQQLETMVAVVVPSWVVVLIDKEGV